jgi:hypothetical protein
MYSPLFSDFYVFSSSWSRHLGLGLPNGCLFNTFIFFTLLQAFFHSQINVSAPLIHWQTLMTEEHMHIQVMLAIFSW